MFLPGADRPDGRPLVDAIGLPLTGRFLAMCLPTQAKAGMSALELHRHLGVSCRTTWLVKHKLMPVMLEQERDRRLDDIVQIDDAFLGGERAGGQAWPQLGGRGGAHHGRADDR